MSSLQQMKDNVSLEILLIAARKINDIIKVPKMSDFDKTGTLEQLQDPRKVNMKSSAL